MINRNKRSIALDLKDARGVEVARRLARDADVVLENFRPGVADRLGIGYQALRAENEGLVYCSINGFGSEGPYSQHPAYDTVIQGLTGFMQIQGTAQAPELVRGVAADKTTALTAAYGILAALLARERQGGAGQRIEVPMLDAYAAYALPDTIAADCFVPYEAPPASMPRPEQIHRTWATADGHVVMMIIEDDQFAGICKALIREDLLEDPRCASFFTRLLNGLELFAILEEEVAKWPTAELVERARRFGAPVAPANGLHDFFDDPQAKANGTLFELEDDRGVTVRHLRHPVRFARTPASVRAHPPRKGEHGDEILAEAGYDEAAVAELREAGVLAGSE